MLNIVTPARRDQASALPFCDVAGYLRSANGMLLFVASECRKRYLRSQFCEKTTKALFMNYFVRGEVLGKCLGCLERSAAPPSRKRGVIPTGKPLSILGASAALGVGRQTTLARCRLRKTNNVLHIALSSDMDNVSLS